MKISDDAVKRATGKNWEQWFTLLDKAGAKKMKHIEIARMIEKKGWLAGRSSSKTPRKTSSRNLGKINVATSEGWWSQMITVQYEYSRKLRPLPAKRKKQEMPELVLNALESENLMEAYHERPPYQQNDYLAWINHAKQDETKRKRLNQMLKELRGGTVYMKMLWRK
jgi:hypothetical protein